MRFYTTSEISENMRLTPEGFLLCIGVPVARTGEQIYLPSEVPITPGADGLCHVIREEEDVFNPDFIASLHGKSVTDDHPVEDVTPRNWASLSVGVGLDPRRGENELSDLLLADLLITNDYAISEIKAGKREISVGYEADYQQTGPGYGRQTSLIANHIALVHRGRCGNRCSIGDEEMTFRELRTRILDAFKKGDEAGLTSTLDELSIKARTTDCADESTDDKRKGAKDDKDRMPKKKAAMSDEDVEDEEVEDEETEDRGRRFSKARARYTDTALDARFSKIDDSLNKIGKSLDKIVAAKDGEAAEDKRRGAKDAMVQDAALEAELPSGIKVTQVHDSSYLEESFQETVSMAEMITPGVGIPTFDSEMDPRKTLDSMCNFRKQVIDLAYSQPKMRGVINDLLSGKSLDLKSLDCGKTRDMFRSLGLFARRENNKESFTSRPATGAGKQVVGTVKTIADLNKLNAERFSKL